MEIAVIIPCFNHANVLRRTLDRLTKQTLQPREVVVVDDGSTDTPEIIVREFSSTLPITIVRFEKNRGAPAARNEGFKRTTSPFVIFLDADALLRSDALELFAKALEMDPKASFAYSNFEWGARRLFRGMPFDLWELKLRNYIHTSSLIRREDFPGFDEKLWKFQDWDLWLTMAERGKHGVWVNKCLYHIVPRNEGISIWLPRFFYWIPWERLGWMPRSIKRYIDAERIVRAKHRI